MKRLSKITLITFFAVVVLFLLPGLAPATTVGFDNPFDLSFTGYGFYTVSGSDFNPGDHLAAIVWARVIDYGTLDDDGGTAMQTFEYYVENTGWLSPISAIEIVVDEPFIAGGTLFGGDLDPRFGGNPVIEARAIPGGVAFDFVAIAPGEMTTVFNIRTPWPAGLTDATLVDTFFLNGEILAGVANSSGGSGSIDPVPEPGTLLLLGSGLLSAGLLRRRKRG